MALVDCAVRQDADDYDVLLVELTRLRLRTGSQLARLATPELALIWDEPR